MMVASQCDATPRCRNVVHYNCSAEMQHYVKIEIWSRIVAGVNYQSTDGGVRYNAMQDKSRVNDLEMQCPT